MAISDFTGGRFMVYCNTMGQMQEAVTADADGDWCIWEITIEYANAGDTSTTSL